MKVITIVGTRPELIKLACVISELDKATQHILVHTGQNYDYELNEIFFEDLGIRKPNYFLSAAHGSAAETIGNILIKTDEILLKENPDAVLIYGDTNSCLAIIAAKKRRIPVFHMEAGNRCFDERVPEEINRRLIDHISDINLVITEHARRYLVREGVPPERIFKVGSSMPEVIAQNKEKIARSRIMKSLGVEKNSFILLSTHREENVDDEVRLEKICNLIQLLPKKFGKTVIVSLHPRTRDRLQKFGQSIENNSRVIFSAPFSFSDYICLQTHAFCVISDSGTLSEEASLLNFPAIILRNAHERPESIDAGSLIMSGIEQDDLFNAIRYLTIKSSIDDSRPKVLDYEDNNVSEKVVKIILGYTSYINEFVWRKK